MAVPNIADVIRPMVGKFYLVPHIEQIRARSSRWLPVLGSWHEDAEDIGFPYWHYHLDPRFLSDRMLASLCHLGMPRARGVMVCPISDHPDMFDAQRRALRRTPTLRRRMCQREMPEFPKSRENYLPWQKALERRYRHYQVDPCNPICPHRGFNLGMMTPDDQGVVVCPGHGLKWNIVTGTLARAGGEE